MTRLFQIVVCSCVLILTSCTVPEENDALWEQTKIGDLAPSRSNRQTGSRLLKTINFDVWIFEIPAENVSALDDIWQILYTKPLKFNDYDAFGANSFSVGLGKIRMWNQIRDLLLAADGKKTETVSILLPDGQPNDLTIARLYNKQTIFYISTGGSMEAATIGPGELALRIKAEKIPGSRGICKVTALPIFPSPVKSTILQLSAREKSADQLFNSVGFELKMSPGDFVFLGPKRYISNQITLGSLFFNGPGLKRKPVVRTYLIVCTWITDRR